MALKQSIEIQTSIGIPVMIGNAYIKVARVNGNKTEMTAEVHIHQDQDREPLQRRTYAFPYQLNGENPIKQGYEFLKTTVDFADAKDC